MKKKLQTPFSTRQYMTSDDFEIYYYSDSSLENVAMHSHDYFEFYFFLEGDISMQIGEQIHPVRFGDVMLIPPGLSHKPLIHSTEPPYRRFILWISMAYYRRLQSLSPDYTYLMDYVQRRRQYLFHHDQIAFNTIQAKLIRSIEEMKSNRFGHQTQTDLCIQELMLHLNRLVYERSHAPRKSEQEFLYQSICTYIEGHLEEDLSLDRLSRMFFVSKYHIAHIFKDNLGLSIHRFITCKRLEQCREAILSGMTISHAYRTFGFGDYSSFFRAFKKEYGISPKDFQDMNAIRPDQTGSSDDPLLSTAR